MRIGPGEQAGLTKWDALLPTDASLSMCAAIESLAAQYRTGNPQLSVGQSRADALVDLILSDVQVSHHRHPHHPHHRRPHPRASRLSRCGRDGGCR